MPNPNYNDDYAGNRSGKKVHKEKKAGGKGSFNEKTCSWGDLPGKASKPRNAGTKKIQQYPKSTGL